MEMNRRYAANLGQQPTDVNLNSRVDANQAVSVEAAGNECPLQALALLNNDFVLHHSRHFAARLEKMGTTPDERVRAAFRLALQREPTESERKDFTAYATKHGLAAMGRVLFNSNEFLFVN